MKLLMYKEVGSEQADRRTLLGIYIEARVTIPSRVSRT